MADSDEECPDHAYDKAEDCNGKDDRTVLAYDRTAMAEDRTIMAVERTFAGWIRTAFGSIAIGLGFRALFGELEPPWLARAIATLFIMFAIFLAIEAEQRACASLKRMKTHAVDRPDQPKLKLLAYGVASGAAILIAGLWVLNDGQIGAD